MTANSYLGADGSSEAPKPSTRGRCRRCDPTPGNNVPMNVVSPSGTEHWGNADGHTACGIDATGDNWWWEL